MTEISDISAALNQNIKPLANYLLGEPNRSLSSARQLRFGKKGSLAVEIFGDATGKWFDHENGMGGDALELVCHHLNLRRLDACKWAENWLGFKNKFAKENKVTDIIKNCVPLQGTPAIKYLMKRGIQKMPPPCITYRYNAYGEYGALVAQATTEAGETIAIQQIYLTSSGDKAPVPVVKRTNKTIDKWAEKSAVRLPGKPPLILAEGVETALSIWQATGQETWACLGISNIGSAPFYDGAEVIVARDGDPKGSKADNQLMRAITRLHQRGAKVKITRTPEGKDFNDLLCESGEEAVRALILNAEISCGDGEDRARTVLIGSDIEIAQLLHKELIERYGRIIYTEGKFWRYSTTHWETIPPNELRIYVHLYDGAVYGTPKGKARVRLGKGRVDSILYELAAMLADDDFFLGSAIGINCATGFIQFSEDGTGSIISHDPAHRVRHTLAGGWRPNQNLSTPNLLKKLLDGVFEGDSDANEKQKLLAEVCGAAALGYATKLIQPRAVILKGERAENGKSQILDLARGLLPTSAISSLTAARMGDERHVVGLAGKLLNASDELSSSTAIASDSFKAIITGEPVDGRDVYKSRVEFRPQAQHLFATNTLPPFQGGMDRGVQRRLLVITFNRTIPEKDRIEGIGRLIALKEADHLLAWAVEGASRLIRQRNFTIPPSSKVALTDWILGADPVLAWLDECVDARPHAPAVPTRKAYEQFSAWATAEGFHHDKLPAINGFVQRVMANSNGINSKRTSAGRVFLNLYIKTYAQE